MPVLSTIATFLAGALVGHVATLRRRRVVGMVVQTRLAGVSFENRQDVIRRRLRPGCPVQIRPEPDNPVAPGSLGVYVQDPEERVGYLSRDLITGIDPLDIASATVVAVTGGTPGRETLGVILRFKVRFP